MYYRGGMSDIMLLCHCIVPYHYPYLLIPQHHFCEVFNAPTVHAVLGPCLGVLSAGCGGSVR